MSKSLITILRKNLREADPIQAGFQVDFEERNADPSQYNIDQKLHPASELEMDEQNDGGVDSNGMGAPYDGMAIPGQGGAPMAAAPPSDADLSSIQPGGGPGGMGEQPMLQQESVDEFDALLDDLLTEEDLAERGPFGYGGRGGYGGMPFPGYQQTPYPGREVTMPGQGMRQPGMGQQQPGMGQRGYNPYQGLRSTPNTGVAQTRQGTNPSGGYPINYNGQQFGGPAPRGYPSVAPQTYAGFSGPQAPPPDVQSRGPGAIRQWQQQMQAVGGQQGTPPTHGQVMPHHGAPPIPQQKPAPPNATPDPNMNGDTAIPHGGAAPGAAPAGTRHGVQGDQYPDVGRPVEGNPNRTNTGPAPAGDGQMHWSFANGMYRGGGARDPEHHVPDHVPGTEPPAAAPAAQAPQPTRSGWSYIPGTTDWFRELPGSVGLGAPANTGGADLTPHPAVTGRGLPAPGQPQQPQPPHPTITAGGGVSNAANMATRSANAMPGNGANVANAANLAKQSAPNQGVPLQRIVNPVSGAEPWMPQSPPPVGTRAVPPATPAQAPQKPAAPATPAPINGASAAKGALSNLPGNMISGATSERKEWTMKWDDFIVLSESDKRSRKY